MARTVSLLVGFVVLAGLLVGCGARDKTAVAEQAPKGAKTMDQASGGAKGVEGLTLSKSDG
jgi:hypothetical protein